MSFFMWSWLTVVCTIVVTIILGGGRFRPKLGLATNFSPYISSIHGHGMFSENVVWYAPHVHFRKILQPRSKNLRACQISSCTATKIPTAVDLMILQLYSCRSVGIYRFIHPWRTPNPTTVRLINFFSDLHDLLSEDQNRGYPLIYRGPFNPPAEREI